MLLESQVSSLLSLFFPRIPSLFLAQASSYTSDISETGCVSAKYSYCGKELEPFVSHVPTTAAAFSRGPGLWAMRTAVRNQARIPSNASGFGKGPARKPVWQGCSTFSASLSWSLCGWWMEKVHLGQLFHPSLRPFFFFFDHEYVLWGYFQTSVKAQLTSLLSTKLLLAMLDHTDPTYPNLQRGIIPVSFAQTWAYAVLNCPMNMCKPFLWRPTVWSLSRVSTTTKGPPRDS